MANVIDQSIASHNSFKGQETQEIPVIKPIEKQKESPTANFPKVTKPEVAGPQLDIR